ncbi:MAG: cytochrome c3 family protein [Myxococcota bacterium]
MPNLFPQRANAIARGTLLLAILSPVLLFGVAYALDQSSFVTRENIAREQPVPFSHRHHTQGVGLDCRYCHTNVEDEPFAGLPATDTCMTCHSQIFTESPMLEKVRQSYRDETPIAWTRVHDLPDFVYFDHSIHIHRGVGCSTCHGLRRYNATHCTRTPTPDAMVPRMSSQSIAPSAATGRNFNMAWQSESADVQITTCPRAPD